MVQKTTSDMNSADDTESKITGNIGIKVEDNSISDSLSNHSGRTTSDTVTTEGKEQPNKTDCTMGQCMPIGCQTAPQINDGSQRDRILMEISAPIPIIENNVIQQTSNTELESTHQQSINTKQPNAQPSTVPLQLTELPNDPTTEKPNYLNDQEHNKISQTLRHIQQCAEISKNTQPNNKASTENIDNKDGLDQMINGVATRDGNQDLLDTLGKVKQSIHCPKKQSDTTCETSGEKNIQVYYRVLSEQDSNSHNQHASNTGRASQVREVMVAGPTADISDRISDQLLQCSVCCNRFNNTLAPKLLACSHTFCSLCISRSSRPIRIPGTLSNAKACEGDLVINCPLCRKITTLPPEGVNGLANNLTVMCLLQLLPPGANLAMLSDRQKAIMPTSCVSCQVMCSEILLLCGHCVCDLCSYAALARSGCGDITKQNERQSFCPKCQRFQLIVSRLSNPQKVENTHSGSSMSVVRHHTNICTTVMQSNACTSVQRSVPHCHDSPRKILNQNSSSSQIVRPGETIYPKIMNENIYQVNNKASLVENPLYDVASGQTCKTYDVPPGNAYDVPDFLRRAPAMQNSAEYIGSVHSTPRRRPPVPPKRQPGSPGLRALMKLHHRSHSCPSRTGNSRLDQIGSSPGKENIYRKSQLFKHETDLYGRCYHHPDGRIHSNHEIYGSNSDYHSPSSSPYHQSASINIPPVPPQRIYDVPASLSNRKDFNLICTKRFGRFSRIKMQTGAFEGPTRVAVSEQCDVAVVDQQQMAVQVFTFAGDYLSMFKVMGVQSVCFIGNDRLAVSTHRGVDIYTTNGQLLHELTATRGAVTGVCPYKFGFVACTLSSILVYKQSLVLIKEITRTSQNKRPPLKLFKRLQSFVGLQDIAVTSSQHLVVLEKATGLIHMLDSNGGVRQIINPAKEACGRLRNAQSLTVDKANNIIVADTGNQRVLQYHCNGVFSKCLLNFTAPPRSSNPVQLYPQGVSVTQYGHLIVVVTGQNVAQVRVYSTEGVIQPPNVNISQ